MKLERKYSVDIMDAGRRRLRGSKIIKVADRFTRGIPDIEILWIDTCSWIETKVLRKGKALKEILRMDQLVQCHEFGTVCGGRSYVVIYDEVKDQTQVWLPNVLASYVWPRVVGACGVDPVEISEERSDVVGFCLHNKLIAHGMIWTAEWNADFATRIVFDAVRNKRVR